MPTTIARPRAASFPPSSSPAQAREHVLELLRHDHERLRQGFAEFERMVSIDARQACQRVVQRTLARLKVHADVEEHLFYPAATGLLRHPDRVERSRAEHRRMDRLIDEVEQLEPSRTRWEAAFRELGTLVQQHLHEEEHELFAQLPTAGVAWDRLHAQMERRHREGAEDLGVAD